MNPTKAALSLGFLAMLAAAPAQATVIVTYAEAPKSETSSLVNTTTETFDSLSTGVHTNVAWDGVGTFNQLDILAANQYGGAGNTNYSVQGVGSSVTQTILNLNQASGYFGLWWSAGDASNVLDFYSGANGTGTLLAEFTTASLLKALPKSYYGNPNTGTYAGQDAGEPFAYINFFATPGTTWSSIVFRNSSNSGFEADNYSSRVQVYNAATDGAMPGVLLEEITGTSTVSLVPEPNGTLAMVLVGGLSLGGSVLKRFKKKA